MSFEEQAALLPLWVQIWMNVLVTVVPLCIIIMIVFRETRRAGLWALGLTVLSFVGTVLLHRQLGMVRLLGLSHVVFWTPLVVIMIRRIREGISGLVPRLAAVLAVAIIVAALIFDYADVARWLLGERGSIV